ncbi:MAG: HAD family hydrolase [Planctomycetota bacterium]
MSAPPVRIALWSGPRNISTALMRSFGARADTWVSDEPLYAYYLAETGLPHPGREEILQKHEPDWRKVAAELTGPVPHGRAIWYQKHMCHHLLEPIELDWLRGFRHGFLIRDPGPMLASLTDRLGPEVTAMDTGLPQEVRILRWVREELGQDPPVVDARDIQNHPESMLPKLCERLGIPADPAMLRWEAGPRATDGCWGEHWYANTNRSTHFEPYRERAIDLPEHLQPVLDTCQALYDELATHALKP